MKMDIGGGGKSSQKKGGGNWLGIMPGGGVCSRG